jgi:signal peptidase II
MLYALGALQLNRIRMKRKYWVLMAVAPLILVADQWTKQAVQKKLLLYEKVQVIPGFFNLIHVRNTGGAFGIFGGEKSGIGSMLFIAVTLIAVGSLLYLFIRLKEDEKNLSLSFCLILSGAIGNLIDRLRFGEVIDFLDFYLASYHWPAFNIADSAISVGVGLMALELLRRDKKKARKGA